MLLLIKVLSVMRGLSITIHIIKNFCKPFTKATFIFLLQKREFRPITKTMNRRGSDIKMRRLILYSMKKKQKKTLQAFKINEAKIIIASI